MVADSTFLKPSAIMSILSMILSRVTIVKSMKHKLSISIDTNTVLQMFEKIRDGTFRNKSHLVEFAVKKYLKEQGLEV